MESGVTGGPTLLGRNFGHYSIHDKIGAGGMGEVYRARDEHLHRDVAIKVLRPGTLADDPSRNRFRQEAFALSQLNHPNIATVHDFDTQDGVDYLVMEYVAGITLSDKLAARPLPEHEVIDLGTQLANGLAAAHERGVIHCDLKPGNLRLTADGRLKILDFGLARMLRPVTDITATLSVSPATAEGTLPYMAPEQLRGELVDPRTDIWGAGVVLYELATGRPPFADESGPRLIRSILHELPSTSSAARQLSPALQRIVVKCLDKAADLRYQSARELRVDLERVAVPAAAPARRRWRKAVDSIAVLPFDNGSADPEMQYLSDGITETLIHTLSRLPNMRVMARSTVFRYKNRAVDPQAVGRELNVGAVLTGRVVQRGDALVIGAELVDVANGWQIWGDHYNRKMHDIFTLQEQIADHISQSLRGQLSRDDKRRLNKRFTHNTEAYQLYLKGRYHWNKWTPENHQHAVHHFEQALRVDPSYALAYAGLADVYGSMGVSDAFSLSRREVALKAKEAALRALELDETLAEAHTSLALSKLAYDWDWAAAERSFRRALQLNPNAPNTCHWYSHLLLALRRMDASLAVSLRARELDPLDVEMSVHLAFHYFNVREFSEAIKSCREGLKLEPEFHEIHWFLGMAYALQGMYADAIAAAEKAVTLSGRNPTMLAELGRTYALSGNRSKAENISRELTDLAARRYIPAYSFALVHVGLQEKDLALDALETAYDERDSWIPYLRTEPRLDLLRSEPRFQALVQRMNFLQ